MRPERGRALYVAKGPLAHTVSLVLTIVSMCLTIVAMLLAILAASLRMSRGSSSSSSPLVDMMLLWISIGVLLLAIGVIVFAVCGIARIRFVITDRGVLINASGLGDRFTPWPEVRKISVRQSGPFGKGATQVERTDGKVLRAPCGDVGFRVKHVDPSIVAHPGTAPGPTTMAIHLHRQYLAAALGPA
jgi:hypothetical protein